MRNEKFYIIIGAVVFFVVGIILVIKSRKIKNNNVFLTAKVVSVEVISLKNYKDDTIFLRYKTIVEYVNDGMVYSGTYLSRYVQTVDSWVDIQLLADGTVNFCNYKENGDNSNAQKGTIFKSYQITKILGFIFLGIGALITLLQIPIIADKIAYLFAIGFLLLPVFLLTKLYKSARKRKIDFANGMYDALWANVVDLVKKDSKRSNLIIEYNSKGYIVRSRLNDVVFEGEKLLGTTIRIYEHKITREIETDNSFKLIFLPFYLVTGLVVIVYLLILLCVLFF